MSKRLVVCCDGTWNSPDQQTPTNVTKIALAIAPKDRRGREQRTYYHLGVGTNRRERARGGVFGFGLSRDVRAAYRFLVQNFEPGDQLFFFGFSRGAFTARSTAGFVRNSGILRPEHADRIDEAYQLYRSRGDTKHPRSVEATLFRRTYSHESRIHFIGVWDTVGALGIPLDEFRLVKLFNRRWEFHDTNLSTTVDAAFQALAIDEKRGPFRPTLWKQQASAQGQRLEQVWFAGVHCDVGGGYLGHQLSDIPLLWMVDRARECGLVFDPEAFTPALPSDSDLPETEQTVRSRTSVSPDPLFLPHESRKGAYRLVRPFNRSLGVEDPEHEHVASTAVELYDETMEYSPSGLVTYLDGDPQITEVRSTL
jgi:uncharacterized protein (DUF2235 family)